MTGGAGTSLAHVALSRTPVTVRLWLRGQARSAVRVEAPNVPSTAILSAFWATLTLLFVWPGQTRA